MPDSFHIVARNLPDGDKLWSTVMSGKPLCEMRFIMPSRGQKAREVCRQLWARTVDLPHGHSGTIRATCIVAKETNPPAGTDPVVWRLLTNRQAETPEAVAELIGWYRARWEIELFFHVLKNGCQVEALQLGAFEGLQRTLALYMITSCRVARLMRLGRTCPELDAELMFDRDEWQAAYLLNNNKPPATAPRLNEVIRLIAKLGGFLARKGDREPGSRPSGSLCSASWISPSASSSCEKSRWKIVCKDMRLAHRDTANRLSCRDLVAIMRHKLPQKIVTDQDLAVSIADRHTRRRRAMDSAGRRPAEMPSASN